MYEGIATCTYDCIMHLLCRQQILTSLNQQFSTVIPQDEVLRNAMIVFGFAVACKMLYVVFFTMNTMGQKSISTKKA